MFTKITEGKIKLIWVTVITTDVQLVRELKYKGQVMLNFWLK